MIEDKDCKLVKVRDFRKGMSIVTSDYKLNAPMQIFKLMRPVEIEKVDRLEYYRWRFPWLGIIVNGNKIYAYLDALVPVVRE